MTKQSKYEEQKIVRNAAKKERNKSHATYHLICFKNNNQPRYPVFVPSIGKHNDYEVNVHPCDLSSTIQIINTIAQKNQ